MVVILLAVVGGTASLFVGDVDPATPEVASFDDTVTVGLTLESERSLEDDVALPQAQVFYSQYEYVVGYYGIETFVEDRRQEGHEQRFGYPLTVYVTDYGDSTLELDDDGYPVVDESPPWIDAEDAWFVVGSDAQTPSGDTVLSFADHEDATAFADSNGGEVYTWEETLEQSFETDDAAAVRDQIDEQHREGDSIRETTTSAVDRPVSLTVGDDVDTIQEGIDEAPENTTVVVPPGTYEETIEINRSITLEGDGSATISGDGNGSVVTVTESAVGIRNLEITGVGTTTSGTEDVPGDPVDEDDWDDQFQVHYTGADAGISAHVAPGLAVEDVTIETPANGVITRESPEMVVRNTTIEGNEEWEDGFAGVMAFGSPGVIEDSTFVNGRDAIYAYRSEGTVIRENTFDESLLGVHLMHTDGALLADNRMTNVIDTGVYIMTGPEQNAIVGNEIRGSETGAYIGGTDSYVAENIFEGNDVGLELAASSSLYEQNVFAGNQLGVNERELLPTNRVLGNDFLENDAHADAGSGPLRIWSHDDEGNYWQGGTSIADGDPPSRSYSPTDTVDGQMHRTDGAITLGRGPALDALSGLEESVSGMQTGSITDMNPTCEPNNPELIEQTAQADRAWTCTGTLATDVEP
ncbi:nitrous oxide reductase accessory protein NosL/NosD [Natronolimnobius sp. AArcel1]|uniref:NosD domain-containing protein n=1 Tax=Natronolimnobius sp. AArcel1 TaxID=1679093 RepID=UPI0013EAE9C2|nr:NosD domain-containing protein [Natronolimnobius sp. AArcel1]NGM70423.1 nitrous oxide reductase accessory protein NosL/NosD [Natronolimnobius sp. AArcel1]